MPFFYQEKKWSCGPAAMRIALVTLGINRTEKQLIKLLKTNSRIGTNNKAFPEVAEKFKLNYIVKRVATTNDLIGAFNREYIIIICYTEEKMKVGHYAVIKEINDKYIILKDPTHGSNLKFSLNRFSKLWKQTFENEKRWFIGIKLNRDAKERINNKTYKK